MNCEYRPTSVCLDRLDQNARCLDQTIPNNHYRTQEVVQTVQTVQTVYTVYACACMHARAHARPHMRACTYKRFGRLDHLDRLDQARHHYSLRRIVHWTACWDRLDRGRAGPSRRAWIGGSAEPRHISRRIRNG